MKNLFLDLEDTVITPVWDGWERAELINMDMVCDIIKVEKPDAVHIFSFAIHNEKERKGFVEHVQPMLERALGIPIALIPTMDKDIIPTCAKALGIHPDTISFNDVCEFWSKHQAFRLFVMERFKLLHITWGVSTEAVLLDDMVMNETWEWPDLRIKGKTIRV